MFLSVFLFFFSFFSEQRILFLVFVAKTLNYSVNSEAMFSIEHVSAAAHPENLLGMLSEA